ncbi:hypothetical protein [Burkholderia sp. L27(2015)]|uniref:hypothetical protein n=1 Tax=Burkholderia sp. L27(2015) TaxID=1641858 RepID=UPI00131BC950|nr:hypothetical protein [Burkholderia sp. L27(2015)]
MTDNEIVTNKTLNGSFGILRQRALAAMFNRAGHMVGPIEVWATLVTISGSWDRAWSAYKSIDVLLVQVRAQIPVDRQSVRALTVDRDQLRRELAGYEGDFESELLLVLGRPSWPDVKILEAALL